MTSKNNRAPLLCYFKLCVSFHSHQWIQTGVTFWKRSIRVKIGDFLSRVTLKFDGWPWKTIGHISYATSSCVHHFIVNTWIQTGVMVRKRLRWVWWVGGGWGQTGLVVVVVGHRRGLTWSSYISQWNVDAYRLFQWLEIPSPVTTWTSKSPVVMRI